MSRKTYAGNVSLNPVYLSARSAIVTPERAIAVTIYALKKWLPRLGPERWSLVQLLRGLCFDATRRPDGTKRVTTSWKNLGELLQVHEETIASWLRHERIPDDKPWRRIIPSDDYSEYLSLFIPRLRYAYETSNGKTRRVGFLLEVLMEDPIAPEDEVRWAHEVELLRYEQGDLGLKNHPSRQSLNRFDSDLPTSPSVNINEVTVSGVDLPVSSQSKQRRLTNKLVNQDNSDLQPFVKQHYVDSSADVTSDSSDLRYGKSDEIGENINKLTILIEQLKQLKHRKRNYLQILEPVITLTETLLDDYHSTRMLYKVLKVLFPDYTDIYVLAVEKALVVHSDDESVNKGAIFVTVLRQLATDVAIDLGLKSSGVMSIEQPLQAKFRSPSRTVLPPVQLTGSVEDAIWSEVLSKLEGQMTKGTFTSVMQGTQLLGLEGDTYVVQVATLSAKEWLDNRWRYVVERALSGVIGAQVKVEFRM